MSRRSWFFLFLGVVALHGLAFFLLKDDPVIPPSWRMDRSPPEPTFKYGEASYIDPATGEKMKVQEFTLRAPTPPGSTDSEP